MGAAARPGLVPPGRARPLTLDLPPVSVSFHSLREHALIVEPRRLADRQRSAALCCHFVHRCGAWVLPADMERRSQLRDPAGAIAAAYRTSRGLRGERLDPRIVAADFPAGHFGGWVREGRLVTQRGVIADEATLREGFALLVEVVGASEDPLEWLPDEPATGDTLADYRWNTGFIPDMVWTFVGGSPLVVEISLAQQRVLVQAGEQWSGFLLDGPSAAALSDLLAAAARAPQPRAD